MDNYLNNNSDLNSNLNPDLNSDNNMTDENHFQIYKQKLQESVKEYLELDDQVDAMTMAIHYMKESWHLRHPEDPDWEDAPRKKKVAYWRV